MAENDRRPLQLLRSFQKPAPASAKREVRVLHTLQGHRGSIWSVAWSPDGKQLATGSWDNSIKLWEANTGKLQHTVQGHKNRVQKIAWSPDGKHLASCGWDGAIKIWDGTWPEHTLNGHSANCLLHRVEPGRQTVGQRKPG